MKEPKSPCLGCKNRTAENPDIGTHDCHSRCELYQDYKKQHRDWSYIVYKERNKENVANDFQKKQYEKYNEAKKKGYI